MKFHLTNWIIIYYQIEILLLWWYDQFNIRSRITCHKFWIFLNDWGIVQMVIYYKYTYYQLARYAQKQTDLIIYVNLVVPYVYTIIENKSKKENEWKTKNVCFLKMREERIRIRFISLQVASTFWSITTKEKAFSYLVIQY